MKLINRIRNFGTVYELGIYFTNPFFYHSQIFGYFSFDKNKEKGIGFNFFFIGINIKISPYLD